MTIKTAAFAFAIMLAPTLAVAEGCSWGKSHQAMSCAEGTTYDADSATCVAVAA
ncbi:MAG: carbohydrate-binding module family 14 protein [Pseudomonadota bacterium]